MPRYVPSPAEQAAIDLLRARGFAVMRDSTLKRLHERITTAEVRAEMASDNAASARAWATAAIDEQRRLSDRCTELVSFAYAHGATIDDLTEFNARAANAREDDRATRAVVDAA